MKKSLLLSILVLFTLQVFSQQVTYVKQDATGANNGTSWADAYTDLTTALESSPSEIWVAAGQYLPGGDAPDDNSRFPIMNNLNIYGGFAGTESTLEERDHTSNPTILSGDISGDDTLDDFDNNKTDNSLHVVYIDSLLTDVTVDGFYIFGGHTDLFTDGVDDFFWGGGGVLSYSPLTLKNCTFNQNFGNSGAAVKIIGNFSFGATFEDCQFEKNKVEAQAILQVIALEGVSLTRCNFVDNIVNRGAFYPFASNNVLINDCTFASNTNTTGWGGAIFNWQSTNVQILNSIFTGNLAQNAGAIYYDNRDIAPNNLENLILENCTFEGNAASVIEGEGYGGAIYFFRTSYTMRDCSFNNNVANAQYGAVFSGGENKTCLIEDCSFTNSFANFGGAFGNTDNGSSATIRRSVFSDNTAGTSGGAVFNGFKAELILEDCSFLNNMAGWGGSLYFQTDSTKVTIERSSFISNNAENQGGAITYFNLIELDIDSCSFIGNQAERGGAISANEGDVDGGYLNIHNSTFNLNLAQTQGGALNISDIDTYISNGLFMSNFSDGTGAGGAISINASDSSALETNIINSTFGHNLGALANAIGTWTGDNSVTSTLTLQNNIFFNPDGENYTVEGGATTIISNGGNFVGDESMIGDLTHDQDQNGNDLDPLFVDAGDDNYRLSTGSPCIDAGVAENAPASDIIGTVRIDNTDIGAFEYDITLGTNTPLIHNDGQLTIFPNPAISTIDVKLDNAWKGDIKAAIFDQNGKLVLQQVFSKTNLVQVHQIDVTALSPGMYEIVVTDNQFAITTVFLKVQ